MLRKAGLAGAALRAVSREPQIFSGIIMTQTRMAYMPLTTFPEAIVDKSIQAAAAFATSLECTLTVGTFAVAVPHVSSGLGHLLVDVPGLARAAEEKSKADCHRLLVLAQGMAGSHLKVLCKNRVVVLGAALDAAAAEARYFDLSVLPWSREPIAAQDITQAVVFGSGRPTILVPPGASPATLDHIAIAWDGSQVAARALGDALPLLAEGGRVSVLTVRDEKPLTGSDVAGALASSLEKRGISAMPVAITLGERTIADGLQDTALSQGAQVLAMGGFGHSRVRDFILGGATRGVLTDLRIPTLLSH
jgi:nucleotide-binding universal stress UspA family protein